MRALLLNPDLFNEGGRSPPVRYNVKPPGFISPRVPRLPAPETVDHRVPGRRENPVNILFLHTYTPALLSARLPTHDGSAIVLYAFLDKPTPPTVRLRRNTHNNLPRRRHPSQKNRAGPFGRIVELSSSESRTPCNQSDRIFSFLLFYCRVRGRF